MHFLHIFAAALAVVAANPLPAALEERQATCANNAAARILRNLGNNGGIFCSSLLNIVPTTVPITLPAVTSTVTVPSQTIIQTSLICPPIISLPFKREAEAEAEAEDDLEKRQLLSGLSGLLGGLGLGGLGSLGALSALAGGQITAGCSCLSLATRTATSTITPPANLAIITSGILTTCTTSTA